VGTAGCGIDLSTTCQHWSKRSLAEAIAFEIRTGAGPVEVFKHARETASLIRVPVTVQKALAESTSRPSATRGLLAGRHDVSSRKLLRSVLVKKTDGTEPGSLCEPRQHRYSDWQGEMSMGVLEAAIYRKLNYSGIRAFENGCEGKIPHLTEDSALRHARKLKKIRKKRFDAYQCVFCGCWHVGTRRRECPAGDYA
jgi:hypothetical protein